ncbi:TPA: restriction endonuclease subunit S [Photobacterium damselae]
MSFDWPLKRISEVANFENNKRIPLKSLDREKRQGIYPYYGASGVVDHIDDFIFDGRYLLISEDGENLRTRNTPIAFQASGKFWVNNHAHILSEKEEGILDYLEYYFSVLNIGAYITGAVQPKLNKANLDKIEIPIPPKDERLKLNNILNSLKYKVALNSETNQTLEHMAQAIFKSWFVDFDPVKAKMNGEQPEGMDAATASLFPEKLVESELGMIPEGWEIKPIKDLCSKVQNGGTPKRSESSYWDDGDIPWLTSGEVRQSIITSVENRITQLGLDKSSAKWVPELSTLVALYGATAGEVSLTSIPLTTNQAVCALMPKKEHQWYNYLQLKSRVAELAGKAVGSAQQNISKGLVESTEVLSVPESLLEAFNAQVENLFKLRICNLQENVELAKLRDTLLPKLLSGEIELGTSEELVEAI